MSKEYHREWRKKNRERLLKRRREYYQKNKEKILSQEKNRSPEAKQRWARNDYQRRKNTPEYKEYVKNYYKTHQDQIQKHREKYKGRQKELIEQRKADWMVIIKQMGYDKCRACGYRKFFGAIDFHHPDPLEKEWNVSYLRKVIPTPERIEELKKTIPLCANCHRELHYGV